jgi:flagellar hook assembly protein FlgD
VASVFCDKLSNTVYFGTAQGLVSYSGTAMAASEDYSDVYAYPNPVKPDYTGWITIKGLMDNSLVKITDAMGNLVYETKSEGGMVVWDGCNSTGSRVSTGVYYVFASQNESGTTSGAVTKILVVN